MPEMLSMVIWLFQACVPANLSFHREQVALTKRVSMLGRRRTLPASCYAYTYTCYAYTYNIYLHTYKGRALLRDVGRTGRNKQ